MQELGQGNVQMYGEGGGLVFILIFLIKSPLSLAHCAP